MKLKCWVCENCSDGPCYVYSKGTYEFMANTYCKHGAYWKRAEVEFKEEIKTVINYID